MRFCLIFLAFVAISQATTLAYYPTLRSYPYVYGSHTSSIVTPVQQQYHTQDELGQYAYGYSDPLSTKQEVRSLDGVTRGSYSYRDANDILQTVDYHADDSGFHVSATNLPQPVRDQSKAFRTPESSISHTVSTTADSDTANTITSDTDTEQITSADTFDTAHVRSLELSQPLANTIKVAKAPTNVVYLKEQPHKLYYTSPVAVASVPVTKTLVPKVYTTYGYPLTKHFYSNGFYY